MDDLPLVDREDRRTRHRFDSPRLFSAYTDQAPTCVVRPFPLNAATQESCLRVHAVRPKICVANHWSFFDELVAFSIRVDKHAGYKARLMVINEALYLHLKRNLQKSNPPSIYRRTHPTAVGRKQTRGAPTAAGQALRESLTATKQHGLRRYNIPTKFNFFNLFFCRR